MTWKIDAPKGDTYTYEELVQVFRRVIDRTPRKMSFDVIRKALEKALENYMEAK